MADLRRSLHRRLAWLAPAAVACVLAASGSSVAASGSHPVVAPPSSIKAAGQIVFCSDITYPPEEFYKGTTPIGSDISIGTAIAKLMGVKAVFANTGFDGIIAALLSQKCDAIISGMADIPSRAKVINFVNYLYVGQSLMTNKQHPEFAKTLADLSGKSVAVETGTTELNLMQAENKVLKREKKPLINIVPFPQDTEAADALLTGKVDFYFGDAPVVAYYTVQHPTIFEFASPQFAVVPVGIGIRKGSPLKAAIQKAVNLIYANGTMCHILAQWHMSAFALPPHKC